MASNEDTDPMMTQSYGSLERKRKLIDWETKLKIIKAHEEGKKVNQIAKAEDLSHSTVSRILRDKSKISEASKFMMGKNRHIIKGNKEFITMEELLFTWIQDQVSQGESPTLSVIKKKAKSIFEKLNEGSGNFTASSGWFHNFKKRFSLGDIRAAGETIKASGDCSLPAPSNLPTEQILEVYINLTNKIRSVDTEDNRMELVIKELGQVMAWYLADFNK